MSMQQVMYGSLRAAARALQAGKGEKRAFWKQYACFRVGYCVDAHKKYDNYGDSCPYALLPCDH